MNFYKALYDVFLLKWSMYFRRTRVLWRPRPSPRPHPSLNLNHYSHPSEIGKMEAMNYCPTSCVFWSFVRVVCRTGSDQPDITGLHRLYRNSNTTRMGCRRDQKENRTTFDDFLLRQSHNSPIMSCDGRHKSTWQGVVTCDLQQWVSLLFSSTKDISQGDETPNFILSAQICCGDAGVSDRA